MCSVRFVTYVSGRSQGYLCSRPLTTKTHISSYQLSSSSLWF